MQEIPKVATDQRAQDSIERDMDKVTMNALRQSIGSRFVNSLNKGSNKVRSDAAVR